jgi:hypothetical protein
MRRGGVRHEWSDKVKFCGNFGCQSCWGKQVHQGIKGHGSQRGLVPEIGGHHGMGRAES